VDRGRGFERLGAGSMTRPLGFDTSAVDNARLVLLEFVAYQLYLQSLDIKDGPRWLTLSDDLRHHWLERAVDHFKLWETKEIWFQNRRDEMNAELEASFQAKKGTP
jgi:hypothetical protein